MARGPSRLFYGWWIAAAFFLSFMYSAGVFVHGMTAFFNPIKDEFGWTVAAISIAFSLQRLEGGLMAPVVGHLFDRVGPRKLIFTGMLLMSLGFVLLSRTSSLWMFYLGFIITSVGHSANSPGIGLATISHWFRRNRGKAIGLVMAGGGAAGVLVPVLVFLIDAIGWRSAMLVVSGGFWIFSLPLLFIARRRPQDMGLLPDGDPPTPAAQPSATAVGDAPAGAAPLKDYSVGEAIRTRRFWMLAVSYALIQLTISSTLVHFIPYLEDQGISRGVAGATLAFVTVTSLVGRVGFGWASDTFEKRHLLVVAVVLQVSGIIVLINVSSVLTLVPFVALYGLGFGGGLPVRPAIQAEYFGMRSFGVIQGTFLSVSSVAAIAAPVFAGWMKDVTGEYQLAFLILAAGSALAVPLVLATRGPESRAAQPRVAR